MDYTCHDIAQMIDHSLLRPELTEEDVRKGCQIAKKYKVATVCCRPSEVTLVKELLQGSDVKTTTVVGFPHGYNKTETKVFEAEQAIKDGAVEVDMVINIGRLRSGDYDYIKKDIQAVVEASKAGLDQNPPLAGHSRQVGVVVKVIFENYYLTDEQKKVACRLSEEAGADFVKTSTGFADGGATLEDLRLMRENVSEKVQVKAAGGVRDLEAVLKVREIGCTRFGATRTETIMEECYKRSGRK